MKAKILIGILGLAFASVSWNALAGPGHDHGDEGPVQAGGSGPRRLPDGSVFLPKPAQRQIGVLTQVTEAGDLPRSIALAGRVVMNPNAGGRVQAMLAGRLEAGLKGLPSVGQAVKKGDVLAYVVPSAGQIERSNQLAQLAELQAARTLAQKRLERLQALADTVPRKDIEATESELASLGARMGALNAGLKNRDVLVAPVSGVLASSSAVAGQVVDARELVFEIVDPQRLHVEALAYDAELAGDVAGASLAAGEQRVPLSFIGAARSLREQALPLIFAVDDGAANALVVGQPVEVIVQTRSTQYGVSVPASSVLKNPANQPVVWVKTAPEHFEPRTVAIAPLDGANVVVTSGLDAGERIATRAATLINQIR